MNGHYINSYMGLPAQWGEKCEVRVVYCSDFVVEGDEQDYRIWQSSVTQVGARKSLAWQNDVAMQGA